MNQKQIIIINGTAVDLNHLTFDTASLSTLFQGLQGVVRFNGYSGWTVAQHTLLLAFFTGSFFNHYESSEKPCYRPFFKRDTQVVTLKSDCILDALTHDLSEALTGDIISPIKKLIPEVRQFEANIDRQIRQLHHVIPEMSLLVHTLDKILATVEAVYLTRYHNKTLIDEQSEAQRTVFNEVIFCDNAMVVWRVFGLTDKVMQCRKHNRLTDEFLLFFAQWFTPLLNMNNNEQLMSFLQQFCYASNHIRKSTELENIVYCA